MKQKAVALISGGIDSPVAAALMSKKLEIIPLHFCLYPFYCEGSAELSIKVLKNLYQKIEFKRAIIFKWGDVLKQIIKHGRRNYQCVLCRSAMFHAADIMCNMLDANFIITGEALGQKASQTLQNLAATSAGIEHPILRPLIGLDKQEIIQLAKRLGLYLAKHVGCCSAVPKKPATKARIDILDSEYEKIKLGEIVEKGSKNAIIKGIKGLEDLEEVFLMLLSEIE